MITKPTVFVLGAGASKPYGYPTGFELMNKVIGNLRPTSSTFKQLCDLVHAAPSHVDQFRDALSMCGKSSVDAFLEYRKVFVDVGKAAIAQALIDCENEGMLFRAKITGIDICSKDFMHLLKSLTKIILA